MTGRIRYHLPLLFIITMATSTFASNPTLPATYDPFGPEPIAEPAPLPALDLFGPEWGSSVVTTSSSQEEPTDTQTEEVMVLTYEYQTVPGSCYNGVCYPATTQLRPVQRLITRPVAKLASVATQSVKRVLASPTTVLSAYATPQGSCVDCYGASYSTYSTVEAYAVATAETQTLNPYTGEVLAATRNGVYSVGATREANYTKGIKPFRNRPGVFARRWRK
jgi:hypothetical protein